VSWSADDLNIRLGRIQHRGSVTFVMLRARQAQRHRRGFDRTTGDGR
jgi:hypothetical protein